MSEVNQVEEEDKLSSLPDSILSEILSHLPINTAASTTILSHRWRHLWTGVTRLNLSVDGSHSADIVDKILGQLTSPKLTKFKLNLSSPTELPDEGNNLESLFIDVYRRNVEYVYIDVQCCFYEELFWVPVCLFNSQFLVVLELSGKIKFDLPEIGDYVVELPNLKRLKLDCLVDVPLRLGNLIRNCPLLEDLELGFQLDVVDSQIEGSVDIVCSNLKSLRIRLESSRQTECVRINIDAPELTNLDIRDCYSFYYFVRCPSTLVRACVDLRKDDHGFIDEDEDEELVGGQCGEVEYLQLMSKFVRGMSFLSYINFKIENRTNILPYLYAADDEFPPIFCNIIRFEITLNDIGLNGWKDLLLSLRCFPNLTNLKVKMEGDSLVEQNNWCTPNCVPDCLVSSLKNIHILGFDKSEELLKLLEYILSNANLLEELCLQQLVEYTNNESEQAYKMGKECQFCGSLFKLPRRSSTCKIVFSGTYVTASSSTFKNQRLRCQVQLDARYFFASSCSSKANI